MEDRPKRDVVPPKRFMTAEALINAVRKHACIWDKSYKRHQDRTEVEAAWRAISSLFLSQSPRDAKKTWSNICRARRNNYNERQKKERSGAAAHSLKPYIYEEHMSFMKMTPITDRMESATDLGDEGSACSTQSSDSSETGSNGSGSESDSNDDQEMDEDALSMTMRNHLEMAQQRRNGISSVVAPLRPIAFSPTTPQQDETVVVNNEENVAQSGKRKKKRKEEKENRPPKPKSKKSKGNSKTKEEEEHDDHVAKAAQVSVFNAEKELLRKKLDLAVAKARAEDSAKNIQQFDGPPSLPCVNADLQREVLGLLRQSQQEDSVLHFCLSLTDRLRDLPSLVSRRVQLDMLHILIQSEESVVRPNEGSSNSSFKLTQAMEMIVEKAFTLPKDYIVCELSPLIVRVHDILLLKDGNWLNDTVIDVYLKLIVERAREDKASLASVCAFPCYFIPRLLAKGSLSSVLGAELRSTMFGTKYMLLPVHKGAHWCMALADTQKKRLTYYDSFHKENDECLDAILDFLKQESESQNLHFDKTEWTKKSDVAAPLQENSDDCGVFACQWAECAVRNVIPAFCQADMPSIRKVMAYEIITLKLLKRVL